MSPTHTQLTKINNKIKKGDCGVKKNFLHYFYPFSYFRPFHKRLDRVLLGTLRAAEILAAIGWARGHEHLAEGNNTAKIDEARRWHSLFQHHDGVTGTARDNVVIDYAQKMLIALKNSAHIIQQSVANLLLTSPQVPTTLNSETQYLSMDEIRYQIYFLNVIFAFGFFKVFSFLFPDLITRASVKDTLLSTVTVVRHKKL